MIAESLVTRPPVKIGVLISGEGTNLQAIIDAVARGELQADIRVVISNKAAARGLERSRNHGRTCLMGPRSVSIACAFPTLAALFVLYASTATAGSPAPRYRCRRSESRNEHLGRG